MSAKEAGLRGFGTRPKPLINPSLSALYLPLRNF